MNIKFTGQYKSLRSFEWLNIPDFTVITGRNGTGKSQLLELIFNWVSDSKNKTGNLIIDGNRFNHDEVKFLKGEWTLLNVQEVDLAKIQSQRKGIYQQAFVNLGKPTTMYRESDKMKALYEDIVRKTGKNSRSEVTLKEFSKLYPEDLLGQEAAISQRMNDIFFKYRISEIDLLAKGTLKQEITKLIGKQPWNVLREIIRESKLPFEINDPSENSIQDYFQLKLTHFQTKEEVQFVDLSSGEKVLISLVFYLYDSQERNVFPKLLLLDEPDAHLHPSMAQQLLNVVKNVLVDNFGVKVIMTTHSPSTVVLSPFESIYEMSIEEPRIKKSSSKNHAISLLTAGLVYVGEGTRYFLVEDKDDVSFYSYIYSQASLENHINSDIPMVFIAASTKDKSGGKDAVQNWVNKLVESGLGNINGLIDQDVGNIATKGVFKIDRYSIENYLIDPIIIYAALIDQEKQFNISGIELKIGEEYKLKSLPFEQLQEIADEIFKKAEPLLTSHFTNLDYERVPILFTNSTTLMYPKWTLNEKGKTLLNEIYGKLFTNSVINFNTLFKAMRKLNIFPLELIKKLEEIKAHN